MDRRRKSLSSIPIDRSTHLRRRRSLVQRILNHRETLYALLSLSLLTLALIIISFADSSAASLNIYPPLSISSRLHPFKSWPAPHYAGSGSTKTLDILLHNITNASNITNTSNSTKHKLIVTIAVNYAYRKLALNFICNLRRLNIQNYIVLAMDRAVFDYLSVRKANAFFHILEAQPRRNLLAVEHTNPEAAFGSSAFVETSRRKSILVLKVLRLGYSVVFSDVDVVWVQNPIPSLLAHPADFVIQSDRSHLDHDRPLNYNLNSGFYLVRSSTRAINALQAIVRFSQAIRRSEQKAFNFVLCGAFKEAQSGPGLRIGTNECIFSRSGVKAEALPLETFPNGSNEELFVSSKNFVEKYPKVLAVHANYVEGRAQKIDRIRRIGFWLHVDQAVDEDGCILPKVGPQTKGKSI